MTPVKPEILDDNHVNGQKVARYDIRITGDPGRSVWVVQEAWEQDNGKPGDVGGSDLIKRMDYQEVKLTSTSASHLLRLDWTIRSMDAPDKWVEIYHRTSFKVRTADGAESSWTAFENSPVLDAYVP